MKDRLAVATIPVTERDGAEGYPDDLYGDLEAQYRRPFGLAKDELIIGPRFEEPLAPELRLFGR